MGTETNPGPTESDPDRGRTWGEGAAGWSRIPSPCVCGFPENPGVGTIAGVGTNLQFFCVTGVLIKE